MLFLDALVRFATLGLLLGLLLLVARDQRRSVTGWLLMALCASLMGLLVRWTPAVLGMPEGLRFAARMLDMPNTVLAWLFIKSIMVDGFRLDAKHIVAAGLYCAGYCLVWIDHYLGTAIGVPWLLPALNLYALALFVQLAYLIAREWRDDLLVERRKVRLAFVVATTILVSFLILSELLLADFGRPFLNALKAIVTLGVVLLGYLWFLQIRPGHIAFSTGEDAPAFTGLTEREAQLAEKLNALMGQEQVWRSTGLSIKDLANQVGVGEHALRRFINSRLGFTNFARYLQTFRLTEAKTQLRDPRKADATIASIAFDCGFNSIPTFNRAFKDSEGLSPKAFRSQSLAA